jgi:hypothetical protein
MPLKDHFHPPLSLVHPWESFHAAWATEIMRTLNRRVLPPNCFAAAQVHVGSRVEIDVAAFEQEHAPATWAAKGNGGGVAVQAWAPPATSLIMPTIFPDEIEVQVLRRTEGATLVAAIELISPRNKDRPEARRAFVAKCASYLQQGIGLVIVDIVTERQAILHDELVRFLQQPEQFELPEDALVYAVAYRPSRREGGDQIEIWQMPLVVGQALPVMALALRGIATVPVDLETTYHTTCQDCRI